MAVPRATGCPDESAPGPADRPPDCRFPRRLRILRRLDFDRTMKTGVRLVDRRMALWGLANGLPDTRLGLAVGRRHGDAVRRNRIKRVLREAFRLCRHQLPAGLDLACAPREGADISLEACIESFVCLAAKLSRRLTKG